MTNVRTSLYTIGAKPSFKNHQFIITHLPTIVYIILIKRHHGKLFHPVSMSLSFLISHQKLSILQPYYQFNTIKVRRIATVAEATILSEASLICNNI